MFDRQPFYELTHPSKPGVVGKLVGTMIGDVRVISLIFRTKDHKLADSQYDEALSLMRDEGWTIQLRE